MGQRGSCCLPGPPWRAVPAPRDAPASAPPLARPAPGAGSAAGGAASSSPGGAGGCSIECAPEEPLPEAQQPPWRAAGRPKADDGAGGPERGDAVRTTVGGEKTSALVATECQWEGPDASSKNGVVNAVETLAVTVRSLAGSVIAHVDPAPENVALLRKEIEARCGIPAAVQKLMRGMQVLSGAQLLIDSQGPAQDLTLVVDECPLFSWDFVGNPNRALLGGSGHEVYVRGLRLSDQVNVVTQAPITCGVHFFEFIMQAIGDEQWCGITQDSSHASAGERDEGCFYYSGRRSGSSGALHAPKERYCQLDTADRPQYARVDNGDSIGMLLDADTGAVVFLLNGSVQGACRVPRQPWLLTTSLDADRDHVELRKKPVPEAPDEALTLLRHGELPQVLFRQFTTEWIQDGLPFY